MWNVSVYRGDSGGVGGATHGHVCPRQACLGVDIYQFRSQQSWASHPFLILISSDRPELCLFSAVFTVVESVYVTHM